MSVLPKELNEVIRSYRDREKNKKEISQYLQQEANRINERKAQQEYMDKKKK